MGNEERKPRRRGRPPGSRKTLPLSRQKRPRTTQNGQLEQPNTPMVDRVQLDDEQLAHSVAEEHLSPFSSFLRHILLQDREKISRLAHELDVTEVTVYRWMNGTSEPRNVHLKRLPEVLNEHKGNLTYAINQTFPAALTPETTGVQEIRKDIYRHVLELIEMTVDDETRYWQVSQALFEYALLHLDSERQGLAVTYASLMPAHADGIHSLRETTMRGNAPWPFSIEGKAYLGSTTLAGMAAMLLRLQVWNDRDSEDRLQLDIDEFEQSAAAYPVMRAGRIAGVLIISSTQPGFFMDSLACQAVIEYAQLLSLALREQDFHPSSLLHLRPMPDVRWQRAEIERSYMSRVVTYARQHMIARQDAERHVLEQMELEFEDLRRLFTEPHTLAASSQPRIKRRGPSPPI